MARLSGSTSYLPGLGPRRLFPRLRSAWRAAVAIMMVASIGVTGCAITAAPEDVGGALTELSGDSRSQSHEADPPEADPRVLAGSGNGEDVDARVRIALSKTTALAALADLDVKGRAPKTGYDRDQFGPAWADVDRNGCDTRNDILARDLTDEKFKEGTRDCVVLAGNLDDPYTAQAIAFQRGQGTSDDVQIDHVVALSDAWQKGAQRISADDRKKLANDPLNLLAADGPTNAAKGDGDAATWLPPNKAFRCQYVARQIAVKKTYELWVTKAEKHAMKRVLSSCDAERLPQGGLKPKVTLVSEPKPTQKSTSVRYESCAAAQAAGAAPVHAGDPGYGRHLDRDGDGTACE